MKDCSYCLKLLIFNWVFYFTAICKALNFFALIKRKKVCSDLPIINRKFNYGTTPVPKGSEKVELIFNKSVCNRRIKVYIRMHECGDITL